MKNSTHAAKKVSQSIRLLFLLTLTVTTSPGFSQIGWVQVPSISPGNSQNTIRGISGTSSTDVWAVGYFSNSTPTPEVFQDLIMHWNGSSWQQSAPLNLSSSLNDLWDVEAVALNNVWAVGSYHNITSRAALFHYNGSAWSNSPLPPITGGAFLRAIHAVSPSDIWAVGGKSGATDFPPYVIHYNGSSWSEVAVPNPDYRSHFNDIHGTANDLWAVGYKGNTVGQFHSFAMHWNGSNWTEISLPSSVATPQTQLRAVKMTSTNDVWAAGTYSAGGMFTIHWNGTHWAVMNSTSGAPVLGANISPVSSNNAFVFSKDITQWNGTAWNTVDSLTQHTDPILRSTIRFSNGEIWAGGHAIDFAANKYVTLIYRSVNSTPLFTGGNSLSWNVAANTNNNSAGNLLLTTDPDISQILTYSIVSPPAHGSLTGLPTTAITNNGNALPSGVGYTPTPGYTGTDQLVVKVSAGPVSSIATININVLGVLPVVLTDFQAIKQGKSTLLKWTTASEFHTLNFEVEHSIDGLNFSRVSTLAARGSSNTPSHYEFVHHTPVIGTNYYRLKLVDLDGRTTVFPTKNVQFDAAYMQPIVLLSNPVKNKSISFLANATGVLQINVYTLQGQEVISETINNSVPGARHSVHLNYATPGVYILHVANGKDRYSVKVILQ
ncbi:MAG: T9SS type A sorting domain-containing protein [Chitinophagales bacterium]|nr:T9SS type A sorting domain-containing protein [Chitinophagales bacterium]